MLDNLLGVFVVESDSDSKTFMKVPWAKNSQGSPEEHQPNGRLALPEIKTYKAVCKQLRQCVTSTRIDK